MGDIVGDLSSKRGVIKEMNARGEGAAQVKEIHAEVPLSSDVRLCHSDAFYVSGSRQLLDGIRSLRRSTKQRGYRNYRYPHRFW
jgi:hypothetical protein